MEKDDVEVIEDIKSKEPDHMEVTWDREALLNNPEIVSYVDRVAASTAWKFRQDKADVKQDLLLRMWTDIDTLRDPARVKSWCSAVANHRGLNDVRHREIERSYVERKTHEAKEGTSYRGEPLIQSCAVPTPEQELLQKERYLQVRNVVLAAVRQSPKWLMDAWDPEKEPREIIKETGMPPATVYRHLKMMQKRIVEGLREIGIESYGE